MIKRIQEHIVFSLVITGIILYFSVLGLALVTDPEFMSSKSDNFVNYNDFSVLFGKNSHVSEAELVFSDQEDGTMFYTILPATDMEEITVRFTLNCPENYAGTMLFVDLYGNEYDFPEQEFMVILNQGINEVCESIPITGNIPDELQMRLYTLGPAEYSLVDLSVTTVVPAHRPVGTGVALLFTAISAGAFLCLLGCRIVDKRKRAK